MTNILRNKLILATTLLLSSLGMSSISVAADNGGGPFFGKEAPGKWIIGVKAGKIDTNIPNVIDADAAGIVLGYEFARAIGGNGTSTFEVEYLTGDEAGFNRSYVYEADVINAFFTYRTAGDLYLKLKAGVSYADILFNSLTDPVREFDDVSIAGGIGLGYHIGDLGVIELEYQTDTGNADLGIVSVNALLEF